MSVNEWEVGENVTRPGPDLREAVTHGTVSDQQAGESKSIGYQKYPHVKFSPAH